MSDGIMDVIPTVIGGGIALKFIDVAYPDGKRRKKAIKKHTRKHKLPKHSKRKSMSVLDKAGV